MELYELTIKQLSDMLKKKQISAVEVTRSVLDRIDKLEPALGCYITIVAEKALQDAENVQKDIDNGTLRSPLAGIPMAVKDNICTEGIPTTCASKMLSNFKPPYNATVIRKLYDNGAILLGKLNMDEFAMGSSTETSYFKKTRNPWNVERVPGGSSGGSAAAVASGEAIYSLASDTGGSLRQPASFCGVVGLKPTYGSVSRYGLIACASSFDQIGPITKDVTDCALVLNAITGRDEKDSTSANIEHPDYTKFLINDVKGLKIGIASEFIGDLLDKEVQKAFIDAVDVLKKLGAECEEISLPSLKNALPVYCILAFAEASSNLGRYDGVKYGYRAKEYKDLEDMYRRTRSEGFGPEVKRRILLGTYALSAEQYDKYYKKALQVRRMICDEFNDAFKKYDIILYPTTPDTAFKFGTMTKEPMQMYKHDILTMPANIAGLPAITVPCGFDSNNLPVGLQMLSKPFGEGKLLQAAYTFEQNTEFRNSRPCLS
ncbi:MAG TPA: Asp-tRNA(Asn)/Glu-tRNA(Gln) amidotransferase subunit GatA [Clostridiaceae bacterium]|nr:Asp-tRNA(Asn)/Glu-tRNA(Gln) amidotransferase subunit GatA [Clostridiaceae bacterium]